MCACMGHQKFIESTRSAHHRIRVFSYQHDGSSRFVFLFCFVSLCVTSTHHSVHCFNTPLGGKYLATGSKGFNSVGCEVKIWDLRKTSAPCAELKGHSHDVVGVKYSEGGSSGAGRSNVPSVPGGLKLISASKDGSIFVWDATNERYYFTFSNLPTPTHPILIKSKQNKHVPLHPYKYPNVIVTWDYSDLHPNSYPHPDPNPMLILIPILLQLHENSVIAYIQRAQFHQSDCHTQ